MRLLGVPEDVEHAMLLDPVDELLKREALLRAIGVVLRVFDYRVELFDANNAPLQKLRSQHLKHDFEL